MDSKMLSVYGGRSGFKPRTAAVDLRVSEEAGRSATALLPRTSSPKEDYHLRHLQTDLLGSENYQVALIPPATHVPRFRIRASETTPPILLLPITWKGLIARLRAEEDHALSLQHSVVVFGTVRVDLFRSEVRRSDIPVDITALEFKVLRFFVTSPGRVISRDELLNQVWGYENYPCTRTVDNHVLRLRKKLEPDPASPIHFQTVHGVGYKFVLEDRRAVAEQRT